MTKEEIAENVKKCYNSLPDKSDDAIDTLIGFMRYCRFQKSNERR